MIFSIFHNIYLFIKNEKRSFMVRGQFWNTSGNSRFNKEIPFKSFLTNPKWIIKRIALVNVKQKKRIPGMGWQFMTLNLGRIFATGITALLLGRPSWNQAKNWKTLTLDIMKIAIINGQNLKLQGKRKPGISEISQLTILFWIQ